MSTPLCPSHDVLMFRYCDIDARQNSSFATACCYSSNSTVCSCWQEANVAPTHLNKINTQSCIFFFFSTRASTHQHLPTWWSALSPLTTNSYIRHRHFWHLSTHTCSLNFLPERNNPGGSTGHVLAATNVLPSSWWHKHHISVGNGHLPCPAVRAAYTCVRSRSARKKTRAFFPRQLQLSDTVAEMSTKRNIVLRSLSVRN